MGNSSLSAKLCLASREIALFLSFFLSPVAVMKSPSELFILSLLMLNNDENDRYQSNCNFIFTFKPSKLFNYNAFPLQICTECSPLFSRSLNLLVLLPSTTNSIQVSSVNESMQDSIFARYILATLSNDVLQQLRIRNFNLRRLWSSSPSEEHYSLLYI